MPFIDPSVCGPEIHYEHLHRYAFASQFIAGKKVLDLACGEGYGSYLFAKNAQSVLGVDINPDAVRHASEKYKHDNLAFITGSITDVPVHDPKSFDVIVCFEAIEHIRDQDALFSEIARLLKDDGLLILSTPNKKIYSDEPMYHNPFHEKELNFEDLEGMVKGSVFPCSFFWAENYHRIKYFFTLL